MFLFSGILLSLLLPGFLHASGIIPRNFSSVIINTYPHDAEAFTQGLAWDRGNVFEGTGLYGRSSLRQVNLETGGVELQINYGKKIFAEGVTVFQNKIYQLTWKNKLVFAFDKHTFSHIKTWPFPREGWGITHDNRNLVVSDGSATLYFLDPDSMSERRRITVHDQSNHVRNLNELEYVKGLIYANIWKSDRIAMIDPESGSVHGWLDLSSLRDRLKKNTEEKVLNGIMYAPEQDRLFVTGKLWPALYEIRVIEAD